MQVYLVRTYTAHTQRNLIQSNRNQIVFIILWLIWNQSDVRLVKNQSKNDIDQKMKYIRKWYILKITWNQKDVRLVSNQWENYVYNCPWHSSTFRYRYPHSSAGPWRDEKKTSRDQSDRGEWCGVWIILQNASSVLSWPLKPIDVMAP